MCRSSGRCSSCLLLEAILVAPGAQSRLGVDGDADEFDALVAEERDVVFESAEFARADPGEGERVENEYNRLDAAELTDDPDHCGDCRWNVYR